MVGGFNRGGAETPRLTTKSRRVRSYTKVISQVPVSSPRPQAHSATKSQRQPGFEQNAMAVCTDSGKLSIDRSTTKKKHRVNTVAVFC